MSGIRADFSGAIKKMNSALCIPKAVKLQATRWVSETQRDLQRSASQMQKSARPAKSREKVGGKSSQMARNIGKDIQTTGSGWMMGVGTGLGGTLTVKYAKIQDEGGMTHPLVSPAMRSWAWAMYYQSFKTAVRGMRLQGAARRGAFETFKGEDNKYKAIALTKKARLDVKIPASHWFTSVIERREPILHEYLDPEVVYNIASQMRGGNG